MCDWAGAGLLGALVAGGIFLGTTSTELNHTAESLEELESRVTEQGRDIVLLRATVSADEAASPVYRQQTTTTLDRILERLDAKGDE